MDEGRTEWKRERQVGANDNTKRIHGLCASACMIVPHPYFNHKDVHKYTGKTGKRAWLRCF